MSDMNERIKQIRSGNIASLEAARVDVEDKNTQIKRDKEQLFRVAQGLGMLLDLLIVADVQPEGLVKLKRPNSFAEYQSNAGNTICPDGVAQHSAPKRIFSKNLESFWFLGAWDGEVSENDRSAYESNKDSEHNLITMTGKIINSCMHYVDLDSIYTPDFSDRLSILSSDSGSGATPAIIVSQIAWTAARYDLVWPNNAPLLSDFL